MTEDKRLKMKIYKDGNELLIERVNEFGDSFTNTFVAVQGLLEVLDIYIAYEGYGYDDIEVLGDDLRGVIVKHFQRGNNHERESEE